MCAEGPVAQSGKASRNATVNTKTSLSVLYTASLSDFAEKEPRLQFLSLSRPAPWWSTSVRSGAGSALYNRNLGGRHCQPCRRNASPSTTDRPVSNRLALLLLQCETKDEKRKKSALSLSLSLSNKVAATSRLPL